MEAAKTLSAVAQSWESALATSLSRGAASVDTLLIVQRNPLAARSLRRYLRPYFCGVEIAVTREEAERFLQEDSRFTHLLCGDDLGSSEPRGLELIVSWRRSHPRIKRAVLATATEVKWRIPVGVDAVFEKPAEPSQLLEFLGVSEQCSEVPSHVS